MQYLTCFVCTLVFCVVYAKNDVEDEVGGMPPEWAFNPPCEDPFPPMDADLHCGLHLTMPDIGFRDIQPKKISKGDVVHTHLWNLPCTVGFYSICRAAEQQFICKASCRQGFQYPKGDFVLKHYCNLTTLKWSPEFEFPDCVELCTPFCENNGICADGNICICEPSFRGDRCQFSTSVCDPKEALSPSAAWECSHTLHQTSCTLTCPQNTEYEFQPESVYKCTLDGVWTPEIAPKCQPINIIQPDKQGGLFPTPAVKVLQLPETGTCATWSRLHYRTFDGAFYHFQGTCIYVLTKDCIDNTFSIHVTHETFYEITIYVGSDPYTLKYLNGVPIVTFKDETFTVPTSIQGLVFEKVSNYVSVSSSLGFKLRWNEEHITIEVNSQLRNKTCGLCGKFDGMVANDFELVDGTLTANVETFVNSWTMEDFFANKCEEGAIVKQLCSDSGDDIIKKATAACDVLLDPKFSVCHTLVNPAPYIKACKLDYCICINPEDPCICDSLSEYFQECIRRGGKLDGGWRTDQLCPLLCPGDMTYEDCGSSCPKTCKGTIYSCEDNRCVDGCHCPSDTVLHNGQCISQDDCPCIHKEKEYQNGERYEQDCNACECHMGKWICTNEKCEAQCSSIGDPHFTTFDGTKFEYLATCPVYLVYHEKFSIIQETVPCSQLGESAEVEGISSSRFCTKSITVKYDTSQLILKRGTYPSFNAKDVLSMPFTENGINVYEASSVITKVELPNDLSLMWDGKDRIYIDAPPTLFGQTKGLCGTFNHNQKDDFTTPDGDLEADVIAFATRWQAYDSCHKRSRRSGINSCQLHPQSLREAEKLCSLLKSEFFAQCHSEVDPEVFYKLCIPDLCSCQQKLEECICPIFADYSSSCSKKGIVLNWTEEIDSCSLKCNSDKIYRECSNPCQSSCLTIASAEHCIQSCVQGCACPEGTTLNAESECIPIHECPCIYEGKEFAAESKSVQGGNICTCENALWNCRSASLQELENMDIMINDQPISCSSDLHMEFKSCVEKCPMTCKNMHLVQSCETRICRPGCSCMEGYVLDEDTGKCVQINECGCQHGNRKYLERQTIKKECNLCICRNGIWQCSEKICPEQCTAWGDSHYRTFDGLIYDFHGDCDYVLAKGKHEGTSFTVSLRNILCRGSAQTCSKSFTINLNIKGNQSNLVLERERDLPKNAYGSPFTILEAGLFVLVYTDIGVSLRWDKGTRIYLTLDPHWRFKVTGLCGNFNDDQSDDFQTPSGGMPEIQPVVFADSWKIRDSCPPSKPAFDTCALHSNRQTWANQKCSILKSSLFAPCHSAVTLEPYYDRCISDTCACNEGGDCECLCTAIAAYAHECNNQGVHVKWRTQELCPIQCEECATYDSCMPSCPIKTCKNQHLYKYVEDACATDICVEGCNPKPCPLGEVFNNGREYKCIPESECIVPCLEINGKMYNEGERINDPSVGDSCQSCHCIRGTAVCTGMPCLMTTTISPPSFNTMHVCKKTGWTPWFNTPPSVGGDFEVLENPLIIKRLSDFCNTWNVTDIECRDVESKRLHKDVGQNVLCAVPFGLICEDDKQDFSVCKDYEIRMFCNCGTEEITTTKPSTITLMPFISVEKCTEGWTPWMSAHTPESSGELESYELLRKRYSFCSKDEIKTVECRSKQTLEYPVLDGASADVECSIENGFRCTHSENHLCKDYEIRFYCKCVEELRPCVSGWTDFYNIDNPEQNPEHGDEETIKEIRKLYPLCSQGEIEDIECKAFLNDEIVDYKDSGQIGLKCSKTQGFVCINYLQERGQRCFDYAVRFYCSCVPTPPSIPSKAPLPTTIPPITSTILSNATKFVPPFQSENLECWTEWMNIDNPLTGGGDFESIAFIRKTFNFCVNPTKIECRTVGDHKTPLESGQNLDCSLEDGLSCWNAENGFEGCQDYEIRFYCPCGGIPPMFIPLTPTTFPTTTNPCLPGEVYDDCAYRCKQTCMSFLNHLLLADGKSCHNENTCIPGCRPIDGCKPPFRWSDGNICVPVDECMCIYERDGKTEILSPNNIVRIDCERCQCVDNRLVCYDEPGCGSTIRTIPPTSSTTTPTSTTMLVSTTKMPDCWTDWMNTDNPESGGGDFETIYFIRSSYELCLDPVKIECRTVGDHKTASEIGQELDCDIVNGLNCWNAENGLGGCRDYEVRFSCPCVPPTSSTTTPTSATMLVSTTKMPDCWTDWMNTDNPESGGGDFETIYFIRSSYELCLDPVKIECRTVGDHKTPSEIGQELDCDIVNGLNCWNAENGLGGCRDYEVRFYCPCETTTTAATTEPTTITTKIPTREPAPCVNGWTEWYNSFEPNDLGESETVQGVRANGGYFCSDDKISAIDCRKKDDVNMAPLQRGVTCDLLLGLRCFNSDMPGGDPCIDYEVRFYCDCPKSTLSLPPRKPPTTTETILPTTTQGPKIELCGYWSKWINERHPSKPSGVKGVKGVKGGARNIDDVERQMLIRLQEEKGFCLEGFLSDIECRDADRDIDYAETGDSKLICSVANGLKCRGRDQRGGVCRDYMIRYYCSCKITTVTQRPRVSTMIVPLCTTYYQMVDGPFPLPDSSLKASSSFDVASTPQNARLSTKESQESVGAWIAAETNSDQYLEIDLGQVLPVYGVITKGRDGGNEWVKSYSILYSRDGMSYAYVMEPELQREKIFSGNFDSSTPVEHILAHPFEARFIRIIPLTYMLEIALRADVLGCGEGLSTTQTTTQPPPICMDEMGLEDNRLADYQIRFSSVRDELANSSMVRLNVKQVSSQPGAWVSDILDRNQYVEINFFGPRTVTGVIIQGRDLVPQWVTAFTISYSSDGITYNYVLDKGTQKVFPGNFDSDTPVKVLFPQPLRATYIRVNPVEWNNWISMRLEILGCFEPYEGVQNPNITTTHPPTTMIPHIIITPRTTTPISLPECADSMGFENHLLPDYSIKVSSVALPWSGASRIRLNTPADEKGTGAWIPSPSDYKPVVLIDFHGIRNLTGIITQGREDVSMWIMTYRVEYSLDNVTWNYCVDRKTHQVEFPGNHDRNTPEIRIFENMVFARFIRITLVDYHTAPALRLELIGCFEPFGPTEPTVPPGPTTTEPCIEYGRWLSISHSNHIFGDEEPIDKIIEFTGLCKNPLSIQCREVITRQDYSDTGQNVICNLERGLFCNNLEQRSGSCMNYEVRIGCWACEISTVEPKPPLPPISICPEVPKILLKKCPLSCPKDSSCNGNSCVQTVDCPCFKEGKKFMPGDITITLNCQKCECILKGYSKCKPMVCPPCKKNQWSEMSKSCQCECKECGFGTILCPTSQECIDEEKWCDGIVDCPDDETSCPTILPTITTTTTTIAPPPPCTLDIPSETSVCEMNVNTFITFDGTKYQYEICDHILTKEKSNEAFAINVHKICNESNTYQCRRAIKIHVDNWKIEMGPDNGDLYLNNYKILLSNLELLSRRYKDFRIRKRGNHLVFRSEKYSFEVSIDSKQNVKVTVSKCHMQQLVGLCGFFNNVVEDDFTKPSGVLSSGSNEFGNSWSIGDLQRCSPPKCSPEILEKAIKVCQEFRQEPFANCSDYLDLELHIEACISYICECSLQSKNKDVLENCKCDAFESFVDTCEEKKNHPLNDWRIKHDCASTCEPGLEYNECGPGCDLTCDNYYAIETICEEKCVPGCYCPVGLVHHNGHCVKPKLCQDCVCRGHGDPNYISFDGRYYAFQGNCTYVLAQHQSGDDVLDFQVLATNFECPEEPGTTCTEGIKVIWKGHVIEKFEGKQIKVDDVILQAKDSPYSISGISVTFIPNKSTLIHIKEINLAVRYFDQVYGYNIELPSHLYVNKTEGLCGVCNFDITDDLYHRDGFITDDIEDFAYSWLVGNVRENCILPKIPVPSPPPYICNFTENPCDMFIDPTLYSKSCQNDVSYSSNPAASICRSKFQYAQQCCERGIALEAWLQESGCLTTCPENMVFQCTSACQKTCDAAEMDVCDLMPLYTCTCPPDQVFKNGSCVDPIYCETCDGGYSIDETWNVGPCKECKCTDTLTILCVITDCSGQPICKAGEELQVSPPKPDECCTTYHCKPISRSDCGNQSIPLCEIGMAVILHEDGNGCPHYKCECNSELCPPIYRPIFTEEGEEFQLDDQGCCPQFVSVCIPESCSPPLDCDLGFKQVMFQGKCCKKYNCVPKNNVCIYRHKFDIVNGTEIRLPEEKYRDTEYKAGESWHDGLCQKCSCVEKGGQFAYHCRIEICLDPSKYPDVDSYVREPEFIPGVCCPKYHRVQCISEGRIYSVGEEWASPDGDKCKTFRCVNGPHGEVIILERSIICDRSCPAYAVYLEAGPNSPRCCGHCKPVACEEEGIVREPGSKWKSRSKPCFMAECIVRENSTLITLTGRSCPMLSSSCPKDHVVPDEEGCCPYCDIPADTCDPVEIPSKETLNYFRLKHNTHGYCRNTKPIYNLTKCSGQCESVSTFSASFDNFESSCKCCLPLNAEKRSIVLDCEDGSEVTKLYQQPKSCQCSSCGQDRGTIELPPPY